MHSKRQEMGAELAREHPVDADLVIGIPDSSTAAAVGYALESSIPFSEGLIKNRYVGRTFIEPEQRLRDLGVRQKFNSLGEVIKDKRIVVVDDSIVRGTTTPHVVNLLRRAGATEVHMRVCAPPIRHPCFMGVDMASRRELLAANNTIPEIRKFIGADTLGYLSVDGLMKVVGGTGGGFCDACFTRQISCAGSAGFGQVGPEGFFWLKLPPLGGLLLPPCWRETTAALAPCIDGSGLLMPDRCLIRAAGQSRSNAKYQRRPSS